MQLLPFYEEGAYSILDSNFKLSINYLNFSKKKNDLSQATFLSYLNQKFHKMINPPKQHYLENVHPNIDLQETCPAEQSIRK